MQYVYATQSSTIIGVAANYVFLQDILRNNIFVNKIEIKCDLQITSGTPLIVNPPFPVIQSLYNVNITWLRDNELLINAKRGNGTIGVISSFDIDGLSYITQNDVPATTRDDYAHYFLSKTFLINDKISGNNGIVITNTVWNVPPPRNILNYWTVNVYTGVPSHENLNC